MATKKAETVAAALQRAAVALAEERASFALVGGLAVLLSGVRAVWRHWDLLDRLTEERDAYIIPEVLARASREATMERRRAFAADLRDTVSHPAGYAPRADVAEELAALAAELEDTGLALDPACAVACMRLSSDPASPLFDPDALHSDLLCRVARIRAGFSPRESADRT